MSAVNATINRLGYCLVSLIFLASLIALPISSSTAAGKNDVPVKKNATERFNKMLKHSAPGANGIDNGSGEGETEGLGGDISIDVISILTKNDQGDDFGMPTEIFCDKDTDETYVVTNADGGRIVIYGDNYFPMLSVGAGRGAESPRAIDIDRKGTIYVGQSMSDVQPPRITLFNSAFFPEKQYNLTDIEGIEMDYIPLNLAVSDDGRIYIAGGGARGVLVLSEDGAFSHWLRPMDLIFNQEALAAQKEEEAEAAESEDEYEIDLTSLPDDLLPNKEGKEYPSEEEEPGIGPVVVINVKIDSSGNIYVLSPETSKVYVYNAQEEYLFSFGEKGGSAGKLSQPRGLVIDESRNAVYLIDYMRHTVLIYDRSGRFMYEFGGMGRGPGWFMYPSKASLNREGHLLVADLFNRRVQVLDVNFKYKFPLFQVPFVQEDIHKPQPMAQQGNRPERYFAPGGFEAGQQASADMSPEKVIYKELEDNVL